MREWRVLVHLPHIPASVTFRDFSVEIRGDFLVEILVRRVRALGATNVAVMSHEELPVEIESRLRRLSVVAQNVGRVAPIQAVLQALDNIQSGKVAIITIGNLAAPGDLLSRCFTFHEASGADCTLVRGFPIGCGPVILTRRAAEAMAALGLTCSSGGLEAEARRLALAIGSLPALGSALRISHYDVPSEYGVEACEFPNEVSTASKGDCELLVQSIVATPDGSPDTKTLTQLKHLRVSADREASKELHTVRTHRSFRAVDQSRPYSVLIASNRSGFAGGEKILCDLVRHLDHQRFQAHALIGEEGVFSRRLRSEGAHVICAGREFASPCPATDLIVANAFEEVQPSVVHVNTFVGYPLIALGSFVGLPLVHHVHVADCSDILFQLRYARVVIAVSEFVRSRVLSKDIPCEAITVVRNGIELDPLTDYCRERGRAALGINHADLVLLSVARFSRNKRQDVAIGAFERAFSECPSAWLLLVGDVHADPGWYSEVSHLVSSSPHRAKIRLLPFTEDGAKLYAAADIFLLCSEEDPAPVSVVEAMMYGLPIVATRSGGIPELVQDGQTGLLAQPGDLDSVAESLIKLREDPAFARSMVCRARAWASAQYSPKRMANEIMDIWENAIHGKT